MACHGERPSGRQNRRREGWSFSNSSSQYTSGVETPLALAQSHWYIVYWYTCTMLTWRPKLSFPCSRPALGGHCFLFLLRRCGVPTPLPQLLSLCWLLHNNNVAWDPYRKSLHPGDYFFHYPPPPLAAHLHLPVLLAMATLAPSPF